MGTSALVMRSNGVHLFFFLIGLLSFCRTSPMTGEDLPEDSKNEIMAIDGMEVSDSGELYFHGEKVKSIQGMGGEKYTGHERKKRPKYDGNDDLPFDMDDIKKVTPIKNIEQIKSMEEVLKMTPLKDVKEIKSIRAIKSIEEIKEEIARQFIREHGLRNLLEGGASTYENEEVRVTDKWNKCDRIDRAIVRFTKKLDRFDEMKDELNCGESGPRVGAGRLGGGGGGGVFPGQSMDNIRKSAKSVKPIKSIEEIKSMQPIESIEEVKSIQPIKSIEEVKSMQEVKVQPLKNVYPLTESQVRDLKRMMDSYRRRRRF